MDRARLRWTFFWRLTGVALCAAIFVAAMVPVAVRAPVTVSDKTLHAAAFALLTVWFSAVVPRSRLPLLALVLLGFGVAIELAQMTVSYRRAEFADLVADAVGIAAGIALALAGARHWARQLEAMLLALLPRS